MSIWWKRWLQRQKAIYIESTIHIDELEVQSSARHWTAFLSALQFSACSIILLGVFMFLYIFTIWSEVHSLINTLASLITNMYCYIPLVTCSHFALVALNFHFSLRFCSIFSLARFIYFSKDKSMKSTALTILLLYVVLCLYVRRAGDIVILFDILTQLCMFPQIVCGLCVQTIKCNDIYKV